MSSKAAKTERFCICKGVDDGRLMVQCDQCEDWFHFDCVGLELEEVDKIEHYYCPACKPRKPAKPCSNAGCTHPATEGSKYCSRKCGLGVARRRLNYLSHQQTTTSEAAASEHSSRLKAVNQEDTAELITLDKAQRECQESIVKLKTVEEEHKRIALTIVTKPGHCSYPGCGLTKAECSKHQFWLEIQRDQLALAQRETAKAIEKIDIRQRFLRLRMERRRSIASVLFHRTQQHVAVTTALETSAAPSSSMAVSALVN